MRLALLTPLVIIATACVAEGVDEWSEATDPDVPAELEETAAATPTDETVNDADDAAELDGDDADVDEIAAITSTTFRNPLGPKCADPGVIRVEGTTGPTFWAACTGKGYPLFTSRDLVHWSAAGHIFSTSTKPTWANGNWWAPEIHHIGDGYVAYFTALSPSRNKMCIGAARATTMAGPFRDIGHPLVCDSHVSLIDSNVHTTADGKHYLYYKTDGNGLSPKEKTIIYGQELGPLGIKAIGPRRALLSNTLAWEGDLVEAPWVIHRGTYYYMFYSGFRYCNATYGTGVARSKSPLGPFVKRSAPILASNSSWSGPGHNSVVCSGGRAWIVYHAWAGHHDCGDDGARQLMLDPITWSGGWPSVGNGTPSRTTVLAPRQ
ncbi:MAG: glycoside hydrolase family 43 protein [Polyangiales bacterium]